ncbi:MAG: hypothetical protein KKF54_01925 [Candidatus Omnitrophica bacterium]|nr:hypothetical protein [Candidatus Omnitrophota bacterium]
MSEKLGKPKKLSMANTKQEMLSVYNDLLEQIQEKEKTGLNAEEKIKERAKTEIVKIADSLFSDGVVKGVNDLKIDISKMLIQLSDKLEEEAVKYVKLKEAIEIREKELQEIYDIERSARTLSALIEAQSVKRQAFEEEMENKQKEMDVRMNEIKSNWEKDKDLYEGKIKEYEAEEQKRRQREKEEYLYLFKREQKIAKDKFEDDKVKQEKEIQLKKENMEKQLFAREKEIKERENELIDLRKRVLSFPKELETAVNKAVKESVDNLRVDNNNKENLLKKIFEGERNVFATKIESLEKTVKAQNEQINKLTLQLEQAYNNVQDIAGKAVGSGDFKSFAGLQQFMSERSKEANAR